MKTVTVNISEIMRPADLQLREALSTEHIEELAALLKADGKLPPVQVIRDGKSYWLWDGHHTVAAHELAGIAAVEVQITKDGTRLDARWLACSANATHGLKRTNTTKRRQVEAALKLKPDASNAEIARHVQISDMTVADVRKKQDHKYDPEKKQNPKPDAGKRTGKDGKSYPATKQSTPAPAGTAEAPPTPEPEPAEESGSEGASKSKPVKSGSQKVSVAMRKDALATFGKLWRILNKMGLAAQTDASMTIVHEAIKGAT